ncbi:TBC1 domain family member 5-like isoform X2 [Liolophura sinensis]|uniref:TBC1 domain family member 5-like isoform X2 n=1 Tax=Liolophura sinensis TaxID=3198878 RepID=UPI0031584F60
MFDNIMSNVIHRLQQRHDTRASQDGLKAVPSKEEILSTLEQFGSDKDEMSNGQYQKLNNGSVRRNSSADDQWDRCEDYQPSSVSCSNSYSTEWQKLFTKPNFLNMLKEHGQKGNLRSSRFRSVCWKLYLEVLPEDINQWVEKSQEWREKYDDLKNTLIINPRKAVDNVDLSLNNPLSQADESPWNRFFLDNELRLTIKQDVIRTFPELEFFHTKKVRDIMVNILFCVSRIYDSISYKQGMHELLAPLIFVLHCDHQAFLHACEIESVDMINKEERDIVKEVMDPAYLEHDAYAMFCQVMDTVEPWYMSKEVTPNRGKEFVVTQPFARPQDLNPSNAVVTKLTRIQDYLLRKNDVELHMHLERLEIAPQIYGIRWVRLLFGREFPMQDLLVIWDAVFADGIGFDLVDYIFVAMLLYIRDLLLSSDYPTCLSTLMRYPPVGDVHYFVDKALWLREPSQQPRPPNYTYQTVNNVSNKTEGRVHKNRHGHIISGFSSLTRKIHNRPHHLPVSSSSKKLPKSSSEPMNLQTDISPVNPPPEKRGSTQSLSRLESYTTVRSAPSSASLARLETSSLRSYDSRGSSPGITPDEASSPAGYSPSRFSTLPRAKNNKMKKISKTVSQREMQLSQQAALYQGQLNDKESMCRYCASKLDIHIENLQSQLLRCSSNCEDEMLIALAGIKQVRDILKGTLRFAHNMLDEDEIRISDNHYKEESPCVKTPESMDQSMTSGDHSPEHSITNSQSHHVDTKQPVGRGKKGLFYMSSEEHSEDSPDGVKHQERERERERSASYEMGDFRRNLRRKSEDMCGQQSHMLSVSSADSSAASTPGQTPGEELEVSPNPLYRRDSYDNITDDTAQ